MGFQDEGDAETGRSDSSHGRDVRSALHAEPSPLQRAGASTEPTTSPTTTASTQPAAPPRVPKAADGFYLTCFVQAPEIHSPVSIAATPDGKLFVGEDEYNSGPDRKMG